MSKFAEIRREWALLRKQMCATHYSPGWACVLRTILFHRFHEHFSWADAIYETRIVGEEVDAELDAKAEKKAKYLGTRYPPRRER